MHCNCTVPHRTVKCCVQCFHVDVRGQQRRTRTLQITQTGEVQSMAGAGGGGSAKCGAMRCVWGGGGVPPLWQNHLLQASAIGRHLGGVPKGVHGILLAPNVPVFPMHQTTKMPPIQWCCQEIVEVLAPAVAESNMSPNRVPSMHVAVAIRDVCDWLHCVGGKAPGNAKLRLHVLALVLACTRCPAKWILCIGCLNHCPARDCPSY